MPSGVAERPQMFAYLLTAIVVCGGTWLMYNHFFDNEEDDTNYEERATQPTLKRQESVEIGFPLRIFYGSQSGTAEGFGFDMKKEAKKLGFGTRVIDLEEYDPEDLSQERFVVFLVATYGEGEPTDNAQEFYEWLCDDARESDELENTQFAVFGLGNSQYEFFNEMGKQFDERLEKMGGRRLLPRGSGDDDTGEIEEQFAEWLKELWPIACSEFLNKDMESLEEEFTPSMAIEILGDEDNSEDVSTAKSINFPFAGTHPPRRFRAEKRHKWVDASRLATVTVKREARLRTDDGSTLHIEFDISSIRHFRYHTAHNLGIIPRNNYKTAAKVCKRLNIHPDAVVSVRRSDPTDDSPLTVPSIVRVKDLFVWYYDINAYPRKGMLTVLKDRASDPEEAKAIEEIMESPHGSKYWTFLNLLEKFESIEIDLPTAMELLRPIQPRLFTISSSVKAQPDRITITAKVERDENNLVSEDEKEFFGLCSRYLSELREGDECQIYVQDSHFDLPAKHIPVIMVGPGTGLAPFRAFIQERKHLFENGGVGDEIAPWYLYYGCRYSEVDYIYKDELEEAKEMGVLHSLRVAFSRDDPTKKVYVQNLIEEDGDELWELLSKKKARLFICGATSMGHGVREVLRHVIERNESMSEEAAEKRLGEMLSKKQVIQELWGA